MDLTKLDLDETIIFLEKNNISKKKSSQSKTQLFKLMLKTNPELCDLPGIFIDQDYKNILYKNKVDKTNIIYNVIIISNDEYFNNPLINKKYIFYTYYTMYTYDNIKDVYDKISIIEYNKRYLTISVFENNKNITNDLIHNLTINTIIDFENDFI